MDPFLVIWGVTALVLASVLMPKWLRVAQREHYIPGWTARIARGWYRTKPLSWWPIAAAILVVLPVSFVISAVFEWVAVVYIAPVVAALVATVSPWGLRIRGTSSKFAWTDRVKRLAVIWFVLWLGVVAVLIVVLQMLSAALIVALGPLAMSSEAAFVALMLCAVIVNNAALVVAVILAPTLTDLALVIAKPLESLLSHKWLVAAQKKIKQVRPTVVAITGSYGKTSTKGYVTHLLQAQYSVVPSPASFNNLLGLSRAVNDKLTPGTEVFVAEMGVYQPGEIRELAKSFPPDIAAITVIGEAHLERMRNRETIFQAKAEITEKARIVVLPIDDPMLADLAALCAKLGKEVVTVSAQGAPADVSIDPVAGTLTSKGETVPVVIPGVGHAVNIAVAAGIAFALNVPVASYAPRLSNLPGASHRAEIAQAPSGAAIVDDTYNSTPVGAHRALEGAAALAAERGGPLVVVTPGMIELGSVQAERNRAFAEAIAQAGGALCAVGYTNRAALRQGNPEALWFRHRTEAMTEALKRAGATGVILVENDLPDHYA